MEKKTKWQHAVDLARGYGISGEENIKRAAKHIFARMLVGGATIGKVNGRTVIHKKPVPRPKLP